MRWFKHLCEAHHDEDMELLMDLFGLEAYGFYWLLLEHLGSQLDEKNKTYLSLPEKIWRKNLRISAKKFKKIVGFLQEKQKISVEILRNSPELVKIDCPKLLGYRDEYTLRKKNISGQTPESVGTLSEPLKEDLWLLQTNCLLPSASTICWMPACISATRASGGIPR